jgi:hypothetical protein
MKVTQQGVSDENIDQYELLWGHLRSLYKDVESLASKKQDGVMSKARVSVINKVLEEVIQFLEGHPSAKFIGLLDDQALPQNADALIMLGQFKSAMLNFARINSTMGSGGRIWLGSNRHVPLN